MRRRLGIWLLCPSVTKQIRRYEREAVNAFNDGEPVRGEHCSYIVIGLRHAIDPDVLV